MATTNEVRLEVFEGPLDLLLYLIRKNDLDIYEIPISQITAEYLRAVETLQDLNLNVAGEFLVMAATLMQIKARTLLPSTKPEGEEENDPRADLVQRLLEYQRFKEAGRHLGHRLTASKDVHYRAGVPAFDESEYTTEASLFDLLDSFREVLRNIRPQVREIQTEDIPIEVKIKAVLDFLSGRAYATFREILEREQTRRGLVATFLAVLELIRLHRIAARQVEPFGEIRVYRVETLPEELIAEKVQAEPAVAPAPVLPDDREEGT